MQADALGRAALLGLRRSTADFEEIFMRGVVMHGPGDVSVEERERPRIVEPTDAIIRVPASCICGSDLWPYRGIGETNGPTPMGHEYVGIVEEVGDAVSTIKPGQFVVGSLPPTTPARSARPATRPTAFSVSPPPRPVPSLNLCGLRWLMAR